MTGRTRVSVVGLGYVGLSTAACLAGKFDVTGIDVDGRKVELIGRGAAPFLERGLAPLLKRRVRDGSLKCTTGYEGVGDTEFVFVTVGTPSDSSGRIDLANVRAAAQSVGDAISGARRRIDVLLKSTVIPGTARGLAKRVIEERSGKVCGEGFGLCSNPEFLREGSAIGDTMRPSRIVIGPFDKSSGRRAMSLYKRFYGEGMPPVVETTPEMAELIKYASNAFLATKVSFINLIARICERFPGGCVDDVARGMGLDPRIGSHFLRAGPGFGGSCFPKDLRALLAQANEAGIDSSLLKSVLRVNETQPDHVLSIAEKMVGGLRGRSVAVLGLAFNSNTDDIRESRSIATVRMLLGKAARVRVYDPMAMKNARKEFDSRVTYAPNARECLMGAELAIVMTDCEEFRNLRETDYTGVMKRARLLDARRLYDPGIFSEVEFAAIGMGPPLSDDRVILGHLERRR